MGAKVKPDVEAGIASAPCPYGLDVAQLNDMNSNKDNEALQKLGGVDGLAKVLYTDTHRGLDPNGVGEASIDEHKKWFGENKFKETPPKSFFALCWENLHDPILILLCFAAAISTVLGAAIPEERAHKGWIEGVAIWIAVVIVTCVGAGNDFQKDRQFRKLNAQKDIIEIMVIRGGEQQLVRNYDIVVGDVMLLDTGDKIIADGVVIDYQGLVIDEASLTGESDPIKKNTTEDPWVRSGTQVNEGSGKVLVVAVGPNSEWGKTMALVGEAGDDQTPLQHKLEGVAAAVGKAGFAVAVGCFIALLIKWCISNNGFPVSKINNNGPVQFFLYAVTIIVVAIPEGLPLAVTISLAYSMKKMMKDNNFVRVLAACETMGGATAICSDKTGTLTENRMTVVEGWFSGKQFSYAPKPDELNFNPQLVKELTLNMALNNKAFILEQPNGKLDFVGNRTECAMLLLLRDWGVDYKKLREEYESRLVKLYGFTSARKMASCLIKMDDRYRLYNKGAAEWVLRKCKNLFNEYGDKVDVAPDILEKMTDVVTGMAKRGLRCICLTYTDYPLEDPSRPADFFEDPENVDKNLTGMCIVGIKDPVRKEVPEAVAICQRAGITVRMVTGDNIHTAQHIARECGILVEDAIAMEGPTFRNMPANDLLPLLPKLRVLARSSPEDKLTLVSMLKKQGEVVAVTGDGTNDAPALKESDVGLAMGIAGTEVAKEAADIVIMDDNFSSIVKSVLWGRSVFNNIRKFLQFQLTVNCVALCIAFIGAVAGGHEPLNVLQLLWVNLIMDTMGALALATENPNPELLLEKPNGRDAPLITKKMWKHIIVQGGLQIFWMLLCLYALPTSIKSYSIIDAGEFYDVARCGPEVLQYKPTLPAAGLPIATNSTGSATFYCQLLSSCGYPHGKDVRQSTVCPLYTIYRAMNESVPTSVDKGLCGYNWATGTLNTTVLAQGGGCPLYDDFEDVKKQMEEEFHKAQEKDWKKPLSILFNAFIMLQICNEINARRINDEFTIFQGFFASPIFPSVILITLGLQAIIMHGLYSFFKVNPLTGTEWGVTMAIGLTAWPVSMATRAISRVWDHYAAKRAAAKAAAPPPSQRHSGRSSNRVHSSRVALVTRD